MANVKISQLPEFTGNTSGSWLIMNNSGETQTFKVQLANVLQSGSSGTSGTSGSSGSSGTASIINNNDTYVLTATGTSGFIRGEQKFRYNNTTEQFICTGSMTLTGNTHQIIGITNVTGSLNVSGSAALSTNPSVNVVGNIRFTNPAGVTSYQNIIEFSSGSVPESGSFIQFNPAGNVGKGTTTIRNYQSGSSIDIGKIDTTNRLIGTTIATGSVRVTGSVNLSNKLNLAAQNPLPAGVLGDLAVSSSNALYFHNGTDWTLIS